MAKRNGASYHRHRHEASILGRAVLFGLLAFVIGTGAARAQDRFFGVSVVSEAVNEVVLKVNYKYSGVRGHDVFVRAEMAEGERPSGYSAVQLAHIVTGTGSVIVKLATTSLAPDSFTSDALIVTMNDSHHTPFLAQSFRYLKTWTKPGVQLPVMPAIAHLVSPSMVPVTQTAPARGVARKIGPEGKVELRFADGTVKYMYEGGMDIVHPDGKATSQKYLTAQPPTPPSAPPDTQNRAWLNSQNEELLRIIRKLVADDEVSVSNYLNKEGGNLSLYERISRRTTTIDYLVAP